MRNGPDLFVYISEDPTGESIEEALNLGQLKATDGAFNYEIPPEVNVSRVRNAVVWCRQFEVFFTQAELT
jgi:Electron transfer DM13